MKYVVVIEPTDMGFSAHVPDPLGCVAAAEAYEEIQTLIAEAVEFHVDGMLLHGETVS